MAVLPDLANAKTDVAKLRDNCLNATHPRGRHKARMFLSALGITNEDAVGCAMHYCDLCLSMRRSSK